MKKSLVILFLLALSFAGNTQERAVTEYRSYYFDIQDESVWAVMPSSPVLWYHEMDLYIDGKYEQTLRIGNRIDMPLTRGFSVPVGSSWRLVPGETVASKDHYQIAFNVSYNGFGRADAPGNEAVKVYVSI